MKIKTASQEAQNRSGWLQFTRIARIALSLSWLVTQINPVELWSLLLISTRD